MTFLDRSQHLAQLREDGPALAAAIERAGLDAPVASCPGWTIRDLALHVGEVHRWAHAVITTPATKPDEIPDDTRGPAPDDGALVPWLLDGHALLLQALADAPADLVAFTFLKDAPPPARFWARRQAHETAMHRIDAELASGTTTRLPTQFAADGVDELLCGFVPRRSTKLHRDEPATLQVMLADHPATWLLRFGPDAPVVTRSRANADCTIRGDAHDVLLALWNRGGTEPLEHVGDLDVLRVFGESVQVRWS
jgi:uncharacterized protein (TIGR03083 family)